MGVSDDFCFGGPPPIGPLPNKTGDLPETLTAKELFPMTLTDRLKRAKKLLEK